MTIEEIFEALFNDGKIEAEVEARGKTIKAEIELSVFVCGEYVGKLSKYEKLNSKIRNVFFGQEGKNHE